MPYTNVITNPTFWKTLCQKSRFTEADIPDLTGKVAVITGANSGLGYATTVALASHGAHVVLACRSKEKALEAIERAKVDIKAARDALFFGPTSSKPKIFSSMSLSRTSSSATASSTSKTETNTTSTKVNNTFLASTNEPKLEFLQLDLNDMNSCHRAAKDFLSRGLPLHILINNGGIMTSPFGLSTDGIEQQFAINHMGHFVFTMGLLDKIKESQPSRIVILSSVGHEGSVRGGIDFETLNDKSASDTTTRYGRSKLSNILFGKALARRLSNEKVLVNMVHPGFVYTELQRNNKDSLGALASTTYDLAGRMCAASPEVGALNQIYCATSPEIEEKDCRGLYFIPVGVEFRPSPYALDEDLQEKLWAYSMQLMSEKIKEP
ncbi:hypothetical protein BGZ94_009151 [Podila epigama]|nr:hypothetical protein BGZ94_009151 [Podila epigama]